MSSDITKEAWEQYYRKERAAIEPRLEALGYFLDEKQVHTTGERYLMSGHKLVLTGIRASDGLRVIIKVSSDAEGRREISHEHACRTLLKDLDFAYSPFRSPEEIFFESSHGHDLSITAFIEEELPFLRHTKEQQFFLSLDAFKMQEDIQASTASHARKVKTVFGIDAATDYIRRFAAYRNTALRDAPEIGILQTALAEAGAFLAENATDLERYCGFLTHTDFVPHNLRIHANEIYLLDNTSLRFGNKHESWGRFINYMTLYNPELAGYLLEYVRINRSAEEYRSLQLMRVYKLGFLLAFYAGYLAKTEGDLRELSIKRLVFWSETLSAVLKDEPLDEEIIAAYKRDRDQLRSSEEKERQKVLNQL